MSLPAQVCKCARKETKSRETEAKLAFSLFPQREREAEKEIDKERECTCAIEKGRFE